MRKLRLILAAAFLVVSTGANAAEKPKAVGQYVDLLPIALPVVVDGRLVNYVFVHIRMNLTEGADLIRLRAKEPYFRDALVRDTNQTSVMIPNDWQKVDETKLSQLLMRDAIALAGPGAVASVVVTSQLPHRRIMPPRPSPST